MTAITQTIHHGDALAMLRTLPTGSVHCIVTSPPYYGLRDYGVAGQIGLEKTVEEYVAKMVEVFEECRRVLRADGTLWLNLGDSYASGKGSNGNSKARRTADERNYAQSSGTVQMDTRPLDMPQDGLKPKDMVGIPWRIAFALQAAGWWLRSDVIWNKPNPMPESVADRPTKSHEYVFLLTKAPRYFYDNVAIQEPLAEASLVRVAQPDLDKQEGGDKTVAYQANHPGRKQRDRRPADIMRATRALAGRNRRTVWTIAPEQYDGAHFAVMPSALVRTCILAGTSERGCCPACGAPWVRECERTFVPQAGVKDPSKLAKRGEKGLDASNSWGGYPRGTTAVQTLGWRPTCVCGAPDGSWEPLAPVPCTVLDPFLGSGTTLAVAASLGRSGIGIELNADYIELARQRIEKQQLPLPLA